MAIIERAPEVADRLLQEIERSQVVPSADLPPVALEDGHAEEALSFYGAIFDEYRMYNRPISWIPEASRAALTRRLTPVAAHNGRNSV